MANAHDIFLELAISHGVGIERYKAGLVRKLVRLLNATEGDVERLLIARLDRIVNRGYDAGPITTKRILALMEDIGSIRDDAYTALVRTLKEDLKALAAYEAIWTTHALNQSIAVELALSSPTAEVLHAAVFSKPFNGDLLKNWANGLPAADLDRIKQAIQLGVMEGETVTQISSRVIGTRAAAYADGALERSRRGAEAVARTAVNHTVTQAREATYAANTDIIEGVRWVSVLDGRTTLLCAGRDGSLWPMNEGPRPPAHWNCRSTTIPTIDGMKLVGTRPSITDTRTRAHREVDFRADAKAKAGGRWSSMSAEERRKAIARERKRWVDENIGHEPKKMTYEEWLRKQPASFQDEVLGPSRGALFRRGEMSLDRFVDRSGRTLSLDELMKMDADAFRKAGL